VKVVFMICAAICLCGIANEWRLVWQRKRRIQKMMTERLREMEEDAHFDRVIKELVREYRAERAKEHRQWLN